jgi:uncharacterized protein YfkK (UPF0435 family)
MLDFNPVQIANSEVAPPNYQEPLNQMVQDIRSKLSSVGKTQDLNTELFGDRKQLATPVEKPSAFINVNREEAYGLVGDTWLRRYDTFKIGADNAEIAAQNQSAIEQAFNGTAKALVNVGTTFLGNTIGFVNGVTELVKTGNLTTAWDNDFSRSMAEINERLGYTMPNYYNKDAQESGFIGQLLENPVNTVFNDILNGVSFTVGTIASEALWAYATGGASIAMRGGRWGAKLANTVGWGKIALGIEKTAKALSKYKGIVNLPIQNMVRTGQISTKMANTLAFGGNLINTARFVATSSGNEAGIEAFHFKKEAEENFYHNFKELYDREPNEEEIIEFKKNVEDASIDVFIGNMAILSVSNLAMFGGLFGIKSPLSSLNKQINKKFFGTGVQQVGGTWEALSPTKWQKASRFLYIPTKNIITEGAFEEAGQGTLSKMANIYVERKYDPKYINKAVDFLDGAKEALAEQYGTAQGQKDIWIGGIVGLIGGKLTGQNSRFKQMDRENREAKVGSLNTLENLKTTLVEDITARRILTVAQQLEAQDRVDKHILKGEVVQAKLAQYDGLISGMMLADKYDSSDNLVSSLSLAVDAHQELSQEEKSEFKEALVGLHNTYKKATTFAESIVGSQGRIYGTNNSAQEAKEALTFVLVQGNNANKLMQESFEEMKSYVSDEQSKALRDKELILSKGRDFNRGLEARVRRYKVLDEKSEVIRNRVLQLQEAPKETEGDSEARQVLVNLQKEQARVEIEKIRLRDELDSNAREVEQHRGFISALSDVEKTKVDNLGEFISTEDLLKLDDRLEALEASYKSMEEFSPANAKMVKDAMMRYQNAKKALLDYNSAVAVITRGDFKPRLANDNIFSKLLSKQSNEKADTYTLEFFDAIMQNRNAKGVDLMNVSQKSDAENFEIRKQELEAKETLTEEEQAELDQINSTLTTLATPTAEKDDRPSRATVTQKKLAELNAQLQQLETELENTPETLTSVVGQDVEAKKADIERRRKEELDKNTQNINTSDVRRPNGGIGTQGFDPSQMKDLVSFLNKKLGLNIPDNLLDKNNDSLKPLIDFIIKDDNLTNKIVSYVESNPSEIITLPDGTIEFKDGNHRANLLNIIGSEVLPVIDQSVAKEIDTKYDAELKALEEQPITQELPNPRIKELKTQITNLKREISRLSPQTQETPTDTVEALKQRINNILKMFKAEFVGMDNIEEKIKNKPDQKDIERYRELLAEGQETEEFQELKEKLSQWRVYDSLVENDNESIADLLDQVAVLETQVEELETDPSPQVTLDENNLDSKLESEGVTNHRLTENLAYPVSIALRPNDKVELTHIFAKTIIDRMGGTNVKVNGQEGVNLNNLKKGDVVTFTIPSGEIRIEKAVAGKLLMSKQDFVQIPNFLSPINEVSTMANWNFFPVQEDVGNNEARPIKSDFDDNNLKGHTSDLKEGDTVQFYVDVNNEHNKSLKGEDEEFVEDQVVIYIRKNGQNFQVLKAYRGEKKTTDDRIVQIRKEAVKQLKSGKSDSIGTTTVERVELGAPILTLDANGSIVTKPITERGVENIVATGFIQNGEITLNKEIEDVRKSYVSKYSRANKDKKIPVVIIKQGKQNIAFPVRMVKTPNPQGEQMQEIFNNELLNDAQKAVAINKLLVDNNISPRRFDLIAQDMANPEKLQEVENVLNAIESFKSAEELAEKNYKKENLVSTNEKRGDVEISLDLENLDVYLPSQKLLISFEDINLSKQASVEQEAENSNEVNKEVLNNPLGELLGNEKLSFILTENTIKEILKSPKLSGIFSTRTLNNIKNGKIKPNTTFTASIKKDQVENAKNYLSAFYKGKKSTYTTGITNKGNEVSIPTTKVNKQESTFKNEVVGEEEYNEFINNGTVSEKRLTDIAKKVKDRKALTPKEIAIFTDKTGEINTIIKEKFTPLDFNENVEEIVRVDDLTPISKLEDIAKKMKYNKDNFDLLSDEDRAIWNNAKGEVNKIINDYIAEQRKSQTKPTSTPTPETKNTSSLYPSYTIDMSEYKKGDMLTFYKKENSNWYFMDSNGREQEDKKNKSYLEWLLEEIGQGQTITNQEFKNKKQDFNQIQELEKARRDLNCN